MSDSVSQIIVFEAAVGYNQTNTLALDPHKKFFVAMAMTIPHISRGANGILSVHNSNLVHHVYHLE